MHIAILEDDSDQLALLALWVGSAQHTSRGFGMAAEFIAGANKERFDLMLIDWMLPDGTGADVLRWVRQNLGWEVPIVSSPPAMTRKLLSPRCAWVRTTIW